VYRVCVQVSGVRVARATALGFCVATLAMSPAAWANEPEPYDDDDEIGWSEGTTSRSEANKESWIGGEGFRQVMALYSGVTWAPLTNLRQDGLRIRMIGAQSYYRYTGYRYDAALNDSRPVAFKGAARTIDLLAGWQWSAGGLTTKVFAGYRVSDHRITPFDPETVVQGEATGFVAAVEAWYNVTDRLWTSLDVQVAAPHRTYSHKLRLGWRATPTLSLGAEGQLVGHVENRNTKIGAFVRFDDGLNEVTASGGTLMPDAGRQSPYATLQWLRRF
jgi:Cellulose biosynthesis protein BcsS